MKATRENTDTAKVKEDDGMRVQHWIVFVKHLGVVSLRFSNSTAGGEENTYADVGNGIGAEVRSDVEGLNRVQIEPTSWFFVSQ